MKGILNSTHLSINNGRKGQVVKDLSAVSPHSNGTIFAETLIIKAIDLGDLPRLMISSDQGYPIWITHLGNTAEGKS